MTIKSKWFTKFFKEFDFLGEGMNFTINNHPHLKTVCGGVLRFLLYLIGIFLFFFFGKDFLFKKNPRIYYEIKESTEPLEITYTSNDFFFAIRFETIEEVSYDISDYFHLIASYEKTNKKNLSNSAIDIPFVRCSELVFDEDTEKYFKRNTKSEFFCPSIPKNQNITLYGSSLDLSENIFFMNVRLALCLDIKNETNKNCKNYKKFFREILTKEFISVRLITKDVKFDKDDYENPFKTQIMAIFTPLSKNVAKHDELYYSVNHLVEDDGIIFSSTGDYLKEGLSKFIQNQFFFFETINSDEEIIKITNEYYTLFIHSDSRYKYYTRKYMMFQDLLAQLNGFMNLLIIISRFVYSFYYQFRLRTYLFHKLVRVTDTDEASKINSERRIFIDDFSHTKNNNQSANRGFNCSDSQSNNKISMLNLIKKGKNANYFPNNTGVFSNNKKLITASDSINNFKENKNIKSNKDIKLHLNHEISNVSLNQLKLNNDNSRIELNEIDKPEIKCAEKVQASKNADKIIQTFIMEKNEIKFSFWENLKIKLFKKAQAGNTRYYLKSEEYVKLFLHKFDVFYYLKKMKNLSLMKKCLLEENELNILNFISNKYYFYEHTEHQANGNNKNSKEFVLEAVKNLLQARTKNLRKKFLLKELFGKDNMVETD